MASRSLGSLTIDLIAKIAGFEQGMDKAARVAAKRSKDIESGFNKAFRGIAATVSGFVAGLATVDTAITGFMNAVDAADRVDELSARLGISTERLSTWAYVAKMSGSDLESLTSAMQKFAKTAAGAMDGDSKQAGLFEALDIQVKDAEGNLRSLESLLPDVANAFKRLNNDTLEASVAQELFGRSGAELLEFLNRGSDGIEQLSERARELGIEIGGETAGKAAEFKDRVDDLRAATQGWFLDLSSELLPAMTELVEDFTDFVKDGRNVEKVANDIAGAMRAIADTASLFVGLVGALGNVRDVLASIEKYSPATLFSGIGDKVRSSLPAWLYKPIGSGGQQPSRPAAPVREFDPTLGAPLTPQEQAAAERRLNRFLSGGTGGGKGKGGKSEAQKQEEALQRAYESRMASMHETIELFGKEGEAAKVRYEIEHGALKGLSEPLAAQAIQRAEQIDQMKQLDELHQAAKKAADEEVERIRDGLKEGKELLADLQFELELMRMTNAERATAIQLRGLEAEAVAEYGEAIAEANRVIEEEMKNVRFMDGVRNEFSDFVTDVVTGTSTIKDAFKGMLDNIARMITQRIADNWAEQLFGSFGSSAGGSTGGGWASLLSGLFGGGKASGGWASANSMYEVNERGMEMATVRGRDYLLTGNSPVQITPNHQLSGGGGSLVQNFYNPVMANQQTDAQRAREEARKAQRALARV